MASKVLPRECLPRRSPTGGFEPITVYVRIDEDGNYRLRYISIKAGRVFPDLQDLKDAVRAFYTGIYISWRRRKRPRTPQPSPTDDIFQFDFEVEGKPTPPAEITLEESLKATKLEEKSSGTGAVSSSSDPAVMTSPPPAEPAEDKESLKATTLEEEKSSDISSSSDPAVMASPPSGNCLATPSVPGIWQRVRYDQGFGYYIRFDIGGSYHTYPDSGGPFQSLQEVDKAMDRYFHRHLDQNLLMNKGGGDSLEISIEKALYWPDGRRKKHSRSYRIQQVRNRMHRLLQALVDKHNEDHSLSGDLAYELKVVEHCNTICEGRTRYYHLNFTMTKGAGDSNSGIENLFFAEVKCVEQGKEEEMLVSCFRAVESTDNGYCYGCTMDRGVNMKHPNSAGEYLAGHVKEGPYCGCCCAPWSSDSDDEDMEAKKEKLRRIWTTTRNDDDDDDDDSDDSDDEELAQQVQDPSSFAGSLLLLA